MKRLKNRGQLLLVAFVFFAAFLVLFGRLVQFQVIDVNQIKTQLTDYIERKITLPAHRGSITDRNGNLLAYSFENSAIYFKKDDAKDIDEELNALFAAYPEFDVAATRQKIFDSEKDVVRIIDSLPRSYLNFVRQIGGKVFEVRTTEKRVYPNSCLASHIIGFTNIDGVGMSGLEYTQNEYLSGQNGYIETKTDVLGRKLAHSEADLVKPVNGYTVVTTIDQTIQYYLEQAIEFSCQATRAKNALAIIQDAKNGDILGMASYPDFDPNAYLKPVCDIQRERIANLAADQSAIDVMRQYWNNPAMQQVYEPGSTFKIFMGLIGLEEGKTSNGTTYFCSGSKEVTGIEIGCWKKYGHGRQDLIKGFQNSCNVVFMDIAAALGKQSVYNYLEAFKLNQKTGIPLNGEAASLLTPLEKLQPVDLARLGFGHNISVTPLQMLNVLTVVSNNGKLVLPRLVSEIRDDSGAVVETFPVREAGQVVSPKTASNMLEILENVVLHGSGKNAYIPGYRIAGKTGTTQKFVNGEYQGKLVLSSFVAIAPVDDPRFNIIVVVDEPQTEKTFGSVVAAPVAKEIMGHVLKYLKIEPDNATDVQMTTVPNFIGMTFDEAQTFAKNAQLNLVASGTAVEGDDAKAQLITKQYPLEGTLVIQGDKVFIRFEE